MSEPIEVLDRVDAVRELHQGIPAEPGSKVAMLLEAVGDPAQAWLIIDGAGHLDLAVTAKVLGHRVFTLFEGRMAAEHAVDGPCLVAPRKDDLFLRYFGLQWGANAGIVLCCAADLSRLIPHLRRVFNVVDEDRREYFFRFYDPRVLPAFLEASREDERAEFFGPVDKVVMEQGDGLWHVIEH